MKKLFLIFLLTLILGEVLVLETSFILTTNAATPTKVAKDCDEYCKDPGNYLLPKDKVCICPPIPHRTLEELVSAIVDFLFILSLAVVPLMVIIGACCILFSGGSEQNVKTGRNIIIYTIVAFIIILFGKGLVELIEYILGIR